MRHLHSKFAGETATLGVIRQGGPEQVLEVVLALPQRLVPVHLAGRPPSYLILAGKYLREYARASERLVLLCRLLFIVLIVIIIFIIVVAIILILFVVIISVIVVSSS